MISFWRIFWLEWTSLVRSRTLILLAATSVGWMLAAPYVLRGDGTAEGARELYIHYSLGGVFALCLVSLLAAATASLAKERSARRLQLTMVRPVRYLWIVLGKVAAHVVAGALVLAVATSIMAMRMGSGELCYHVQRPLMPTPEAEAEMMYDEFMKSPDTPQEVKRCSRKTVLSILTQRALDHYQTVATNETVCWKFGVSVDAGQTPRVRFRFTNGFETHDELRGELRLGAFGAVVSNVTQAVLTVPLRRAEPAAEADALTFANHGRASVMLRPRRDIELLLPADGFGFNLLRAWVELVAVLALVVAFGVFLSAALGRPVALFVAIVMLIVGEISPSVIERYPYSIDSSLSDRVSLALTRMMAEVTQPVSSLSPLAALANGECIERKDVARVAAVNILLIPLLLGLIAALILPRKSDE